MPTPPPNPARDKIAAATSRHPSIAGATPPAAPQRFSAEARAIMARHAAERSELETAQWNERVDMTERHAAEMSAQREAEEKAAAAAAAAPPAK